eukprot:212161-Rhodomonas_salina.1
MTFDAPVGTGGGSGASPSQTGWGCQAQWKAARLARTSVPTPHCVACVRQISDQLGFGFYGGSKTQKNTETHD